MLLVILGAGASYDSVNVHTAYEEFEWLDANGRRPPLADEIFGSREDLAKYADRYPQARGLIVELRAGLARGGGSLEQQLAIVQERAATHPRDASRLMAVRFYIRDLIRDVTDE
jgi:hypothetical protein